MDAKSKIAKMLKEIFDDGVVNAMQVWKGSSPETGMTGWHYKKFGENATYMGDSVRECREFVDEEKGLRADA